MQRRIEAHKGIVVIVRGGIGKFEDMAGETYTIELVNGTWTVTRDVWDEDANDWTSVQSACPGRRSPGTIASPVWWNRGEDDEESKRDVARAGGRHPGARPGHRRPARPRGDGVDATRQAGPEAAAGRAGWAVCPAPG